MAPTLNLVVKNSSVAAATISFALIAMALFVAIVWLPETLPRCNNNEPASDETLALRIQANDSASEEVEEDNHEQSIVSRTTTSPQWTESWPSVATRPIREISILLRHRRLRMLTVGSFFAAMVYAADTTLVIYYVEETLDMQKSDIAIMTFVMGTAGILVQGGLLQHLIALFGEYPVLVISFLSGILHNFLYGVARAKGTIYVALIVSQLSKTNFPLLSSLSSKCVDEHEQGRVQSALFAVNAIANAIGPLSLEFVYHYSKHMSGIWASPGFMFIFAAFLYAVGTVVVALIPANPAETQRSQDQESNSISTTNADPAAIECTETSELLSDRMNMTEPLLASNA